MNNGILSSGYAPPQMPGALLGSPAPLEMIDAYGYDADARRYIRAVEAADGQRLELAVRNAINEFVVGCKADGIWSAIKASCILCGARTLSGALVPLVGAAPTNNNFVSGDYSRRNGVLGNGSTKYIDTNRNNNADLQNDRHISVFVTAAPTSANGPLLATPRANGSTWIFTQTGNITSIRMSQDASFSAGGQAAIRMVGVARQNAAGFVYRVQNTTITAASQSSPPSAQTLRVFFGVDGQYADGRAAFYSVGGFLSLSALDFRVSALVAAIGAAIP